MQERERIFCDEYIACLNAVIAATKAGYAEKTARYASRWLNPDDSKNFKPNLKKYIDEQLERIHNERTADAQEVLEYLTSVMRGEHKEQILKLVGEGVQTIADIDVAARERLKAAELIGKRYGMFKDGLNIGGVVPVMFVDDLEEDE